MKLINEFLQENFVSFSFVTFNTVKLPRWIESSISVTSEQLDQDVAGTRETGRRVETKYYSHSESNSRLKVSLVQADTSRVASCKERNTHTHTQTQAERGREGKRGRERIHLPLPRTQAQNEYKRLTDSKILAKLIEKTFKLRKLLVHMIRVSFSVASKLTSSGHQVCRCIYLSRVNELNDASCIAHEYSSYGTDCKCSQSSREHFDSPTQ